MMFFTLKALFLRYFILGSLSWLRKEGIIGLDSSVALVVFVGC